MLIPTLNMIGCGQVGQTLGYLWHQQASVRLGDVLNRSRESGEAATRFMGAGRALDDMAGMQAAGLYLLGCPDNHIGGCCQQLADSGLLRAGDVVFHCSGALPSALLEPARAQGAAVASLHPVKGFTDPAQASQSFAQTWCGLEGDEAALRVLEPLVQAIGGIPFRIDPAKKTLYHAASVFACNYLVALQEVSLKLFAEAGVGRGQALQMLQPIVQDTVRNLFAVGTVQALPGPIARGDYQVVGRQWAAVQGFDAEMGELYRLLGRQALELARQRGKAVEGDLDRVGECLR